VGGAHSALTTGSAMNGRTVAAPYIYAVVRPTEKPLLGSILIKGNNLIFHAGEARALTAPGHGVSTTKVPEIYYITGQCPCRTTGNALGIRQK